MAVTPTMYMLRGDRRTFKRLKRCSKWKAPVNRLSRKQFRLRCQLWRLLDDWMA